MIHHIKSATRHFIIWSLVTLAVSLTVVRLLLLGIENYKADLSAHLSEYLGAPVVIGRMSANMRGYNPELVLKDIKILSSNSRQQSANEKPAIQLREIRMGINLLDMLISRDRFSSAWVTLVGAKLSVKRKADGSFAIIGLKADNEQPLWLLQGKKYEVLQSEITWQDEKKNSRPLTFGAVDLAIINNGQQHRMNAIMNLPKKFGDKLILSMNLSGDVFKPSSIDGSIYVDGKNLNLVEWVAYDLPFAMEIHSGVGDIRVWSELHQSQVVSFTGDMQFSRLHLSRPDKGIFSVKNLDALFHWTMSDNQWQLDVSRFLLETAEKDWPPAVLSISGKRTQDSSLRKLGLFVEYVDVEEVSRLLHFFAPLSEADGEQLAQARMKGSLEQFSLFADLDEIHFAVNGKFTNLSIAPFATVPGIENMTGQLKGDEVHGNLKLAAKDVRLTALGLFRDALSIKTLDGEIGWQQTPDNWVISSSAIILNFSDLMTKSKVNLKFPKTEELKTFLDLQIAFSADDVSKVKQYLPVKVMKNSVVDWLDHAFIKGRVPKGNLLLYGNLSDFPFLGGQGVFETLFAIEQLELAYHSDWPHLMDLDGEVTFLQGGLQVDLHKGSSKKVEINQARVVIPVLGESSHLLVQGQLETELQEGLEFLQETPFNSPADKLLNAIKPFGNTHIKLDLKLPLVDEAKADVNGSAQLNNAKLEVKALDLMVHHINGELKFNEQGVYGDSIKAEALNNPIQTSIVNSPSQTTVQVEGRVGVRDLRSHFKLPVWQVAEGETGYRLKLQLPYDDKTPELLVESNLAGVILDLPGPSLAKSEDQLRSLNMIFSLVEQTYLPINLNYNNQLKAAIRFDRESRRIEAANVLVGTGDVVQPKRAGIKLEINREQLIFQDWIGLAASLFKRQDAESASVGAFQFEEIHIHSAHSLWKNTDLGFLDLKLKSKGRFLVGNMNGSIAKGELKIPFDLTGTDGILLALDELDLTMLKNLKDQSDGLKSESVVNEMPLINVTSQKTLWQSLDLGKLKIATDRIIDGIAFNRIELSGNDQNLVLSGEWKVNGSTSETRIQGNLSMPHAGQFLSKLGITKDLTETSAEVDLTGEWEGAPYQFSLTDLRGQVDVNFTSGRILGIEPGFGRVLGILAMAQWLKRFQLDFSDIFDEGLTFINILGHFDISNGKATTNDLLIDAVPAKITLTGHTDLINETVDYGVSVIPKSADAVPIAGTIMGKVADLIGRTLTGKDQQGFFFGSKYLVKGKWRDAKIIPLHEDDGVLQKTWNGITGFPWLQQTNEP